MYIIFHFDLTIQNLSESMYKQIISLLCLTYYIKLVFLLRLTCTATDLSVNWRPVRVSNTVLEALGPQAVEIKERVGREQCLQ